MENSFNSDGDDEIQLILKKKPRYFSFAKLDLSLKEFVILINLIEDYDPRPPSFAAKISSLEKKTYTMLRVYIRFKQGLVFRDCLLDFDVPTNYRRVMQGEMDSIQMVKYRLNV